MSGPVHGSARASGTAVLFVLLVSLALPVPASADEGCGAPGRPACTLLRPVVARESGAPGLGAPDCVVQIGGLAGTADTTERAFEALAIDGTEISVLDYDSLGKIAAAAELLRAHIGRIREGCGAIHLVAHSLGGVVADRAFSKGLSDAHRVATYLPLASPHNGSGLARELCGVEDVDPGYSELLRDVAALLGLPDPTAEAVCDLAQVRPPRPPRGVATARLRLVTDPVVVRGDHVAHYFDVRELLPSEAGEIEGHTGILRSPQAREMVRRSIEQRSIADDERGADERIAADLASRSVEQVASAAHRTLGDIVWTGAAVARLIAIARGALDKMREGVAIAGPHLLSYLSHLPTVGSARFDR